MTFSTRSLVAEADLGIPKIIILDETCKVWVPTSVVPEAMVLVKNLRRGGPSMRGPSRVAQQSRDGKQNEFY